MASNCFETSPKFFLPQRFEHCQLSYSLFVEVSVLKLQWQLLRKLNVYECKQGASLAAERGTLEAKLRQNEEKSQETESQNRKLQEALCIKVL